MYEALYYIFAVLSIGFCMFTAFSEKRTAYYFVIFLFIYCGLLVLLNSALIALVILLIVFISVLLLMLFEKYKMFDKPSDPISVKGYSFLIITGLFTAITASLVSSTRLPVFDIDFTKINFSLIFSVYLPVILLISVVVSAILPFVLSAYRKKEIV